MKRFSCWCLKSAHLRPARALRPACCRFVTKAHKLPDEGVSASGSISQGQAAKYIGLHVNRTNLELYAM
jgi:hypothetical protein